MPLTEDDRRLSVLRIGAARGPIYRPAAGEQSASLARSITPDPYGPYLVERLIVSQSRTRSCPLAALLHASCSFLGATPRTVSLIPVRALGPDHKERKSRTPASQEVRFGRTFVSFLPYGMW
jgi:hypothetical protein